MKLQTNQNFIIWAKNLQFETIVSKWASFDQSMWESSTCLLEVLNEKGFLDIIQSLRLDLAAIEAASRKAEVNLMGETGPLWPVHSSHPNPKDPTK